jgi:hypothetical protein
MKYPDTCPHCGCSPKTAQQIAQKIDRRVYACESWTNADAKGLSWRSHTCEYWRTIKDAAAVIRAFLDGDRDAREKGQNWIAENTP